MTTLPHTLAVFGFVASAFSATAFGDTYEHIDQLALSLERQARRVVCETGHYRYTPEYRHLIVDARELAQLADHLHDVAHHHGCLSRMAADLSAIDAKFHHLESLFDRIEARAARGYGHVHGHTSHVRRLLNSMGDNIHHLQYEVRSLRTTVHPVRPVTVHRPAIYNSPSNHWYRNSLSPYGGNNGYGGGYQYRSPGRGITFGGGSSRFTIRF